MAVLSINGLKPGPVIRERNKYFITHRLVHLSIAALVFNGAVEAGNDDSFADITFCSRT